MDNMCQIMVFFRMVSMDKMAHAIDAMEGMDAIEHYQHTQGGKSSCR